MRLARSGSCIVGGIMDTSEQAARRIFGARADKYTTSAAHTDPWVLGRVVELAAPAPDWRVLDLGQVAWRRRSSKQ